MTTAGITISEVTKCMELKTRIYVTGGTGLVGSNFIKVALERHQAKVFTTVHKYQPFPPVAFEYDTVDMRNRDQVLKTVRAFQPDAIVHMAYLNDFQLMYRDRKLGWQSLVEATRYLAEATREVGAKMILVSTDWVFDGTQSPADERTPPNPINYYGIMKAVGETLIGAMTGDWAVARTAGVYGVHWARPEWRPTQNAGFGYFPNAVTEILRQNQPFTVWEGDVNVRATPTLAVEVGEMIMQIIKRDRRGIFHCCGGECITRLDFARATAEVFELDPDLIRVGPYDPSDPGSLHGLPVPRDTCLSADYTARELEHPLLDVRQSLTEFRRQVETGSI